MTFNWALATETVTNGIGIKIHETPCACSLRPVRYCEVLTRVRSCCGEASRPDCDACMTTSGRAFSRWSWTLQGSWRRPVGSMAGKSQAESSLPKVSQEGERLVAPAADRYVHPVHHEPPILCTWMFSIAGLRRSAAGGDRADCPGLLQHLTIRAVNSCGRHWIHYPDVHQYSPCMMQE